LLFQAGYIARNAIAQFLAADRNKAVGKIFIWYEISGKMLAVLLEQFFGPALDNGGFDSSHGEFQLGIIYKD